MLNFNKLYGADYRRDLADHIVCILQLEVGQTFSTADEIIKQLNDKNISDFIVAHNYISEYIKSDNQEYFKLEKFFKPEKYKPKEIWVKYKWSRLLYFAKKMMNGFILLDKNSALINKPSLMRWFFL